MRLRRRCVSSAATLKKDVIGLRCCVSKQYVECMFGEFFKGIEGLHRGMIIGDV